jgi:hypothetical protein
MYGIHLLFCIKNITEFSLKGDFYSELFNYTEIRLQKCTNTSISQNCKSEEEIAEYFKHNTLSLVVINSYFEYTDFRSRPLDHPPPDGLFVDEYGSIR